jgi:hypothetical protein
MMKILYNCIICSLLKLFYYIIIVINCTNSFKIFSTFIIAVILLTLTGTNYTSAYNLHSHNFHFGPIASINNDWILAGQWMSSINSTDPTDVGFHSIFNMVMKNGTAPHIYKIYNASVNDVTKQGNDTIFKGSVSITMKDGPIENVPTTITISNNNTIAVSLDPTTVNNHFGNTPIYGLIHNYKQGMELMMEDSEVLQKWIPFMTANIMQNMNTMKIDHSMMMNGTVPNNSK